LGSHKQESGIKSGKEKIPQTAFFHEKRKAKIGTDTSNDDSEWGVLRDGELNS